ncbi:Alpha/Beta hydrolase protein [Aspergillus caelatus]|uniref:Alpha/Beta hydrolase protein n=2 Tax=Aspergillus subgen. Circumdati TaxID=2720871 RepID=A0A5N7AAH9_9EURO|nr:Alpha/Beta hydrolase protein [Aspergillus caelatus]KAE8366897.1 Alpha/Beta hydrolase protein [Aspergillus caelatus]KAE8420026.1 Alpha/Beta hydrolase protein [Aspergillus pseudocaelatus]
MSLQNQPFTKLPESTTRSSKTTINIAGFHVYLYGADELSQQQAKDTVVLFHVHGRTRSYADAELFAHQFLFQLKQMGSLTRGFVVATFDSRNHGERAIDSLAVQDWNGGNQKHAHDMLAMIDGNVLDIQTVMKYLSVYTEGRFTPTEFVMSGLSLGGHTAWDILSKVQGIKAAIIIVGSPNLTDLLIERLGNAADSKIGADSTKWPESISSMYRARDQVLGHIDGKSILILNGALDALVPSKFTVPWVEKNGSRNDVSFNVFENTGHWLSLEMMDTIVQWVLQKHA